MGTITDLSNYRLKRDRDKLIAMLERSGLLDTPLAKPPKNPDPPSTEVGP